MNFASSSSEFLALKGINSVPLNQIKALLKSCIVLVSESNDAQLLEVLDHMDGDLSTNQQLARFLLILIHKLSECDDDKEIDMISNSLFKEIGIQDNIINLIINLIKENYTNLKESKLIINKKIEEKNELIDIDWIFGVTASSDECDKIGKTFLQMKLKIKSNNNEKHDLFFEMTLEQFYHFLAQLETAKAQLDLVLEG